ncbi:MAG: glucosylglycerol hydrolase, partial [Thiohalobacterales bacterium]|nr:glucosylglycerol hydrolase [Thiohalobacterales bacterium]
MGLRYLFIRHNGISSCKRRLFFHAFLPGTPMDFLQASVRAPWSFIRNTDHRYALKVWGEEARFLDWRVTDEDYADPVNFTRLKALGFSDR